MTDQTHTQTAQEHLDLRDILQLLRRQLRLILLVSALVIGAAVLYVVSVTPVYTARSLIMVDPTQQNLLEADDTMRRAPMIDNARVDSEVEILRAPATTLAVIQSAGLVTDDEFGPSVSFFEEIRLRLGLGADEPPSGPALLQAVRQALQDATTIRRIGLTHLISIDVTSTSPEKAAYLANLMAQTYIDAQVDTKIAASQSARDILSRQVEAGRVAVAASDKALNDFIDASLEDLARQGGNPNLAVLQNEINNLRSELSRNELRLSTATTAFETRDFTALAESLADEALRELAAEQAEITRQLEEASAGGLVFFDLQNALAEVDARIEERAGAQLAAISQNVAQITSQTENLRATLRENLVSSDLPSDVLARIFELQQAASITRSQYQTLLAQFGEIETRAALQVADSRIVSPALPPNAPSAPNKRLILTIAAMLGLGLGLGLAVLNETYIGGITNPDQLRMVTGHMAASAVPRLDEKDNKIMVDQIIDDPLSIYSESIRKLRAAIELQRRRTSNEARVGPEGHVIMVTSTLPAEGKTTIALSLARIYAATGKSTLLIDADLRKPSVAAYLGQKPKKGLLTYLDPEQFSDTITDKTAEPQLSLLKDNKSPLRILPGADRPQIATDQLISSLEFENLLNQARSLFEVIIIDTSPVLPVVDARYIAPQVDMIVMPVKWAATRLADFRSAYSILMQSTASAVPIVTALNLSEAKQGVYGYGYGYGRPYGG
ncbi:Wzz/FepE/Etk N-terminal domain-containing protein [Roseovarius sp. 10]|uniref:GumC family protein n=1 Tax=Roseovarius sp. 10 TaxID=3080563 RepID=UPI002952F781|nr:Wzz/FepE/Etk N-terminal domain-containing protein [Roseovarius sp. 10]MDV7200669.1 Wzz/FepE/Etk N-terminal domain-containing protein [Roseovarius sp. 10]